MKKRKVVCLAILLIFILFAIASVRGVTSYSSSSEAVPVPEPSQKTLDYYNGDNVLWIMGTILSFAMLSVILFFGFSAKIRNFSKKTAKNNWVFTILIYFLILSLIDFLIFLPLSFYSSFIREHAYGLSDQTFIKWVSDSIISLIISIISGGFVACIFYLLVKKSPKRWWLYMGILSIPLIIFMMLIEPLWIAPLYNDFGPMSNQTLEAKISSLAQQAGVEGSSIFQVNKSVDTNTINAYVAGFLNSKRIVIWDTTINTLEEKEILFIVAHELGHYVLGHVTQIIIIYPIFIILSLFLMNLSINKIIKRFKKRFGFKELSDIASLPLILLILNLYFLIFTPFLFAYSRNIEHQADTFAIELTRDNYHCATAFAKMVNDNNFINPRPGLLYQLFRGSHPSLGERIDFCNSYNPWETGNFKYASKFKQIE